MGMRFRYSLVLTAAAFALTSVSTVSVAQAAAKQGAATNSPYAAQITALRAARTLLETADHDYNGHRAAAVKLVSEAIHALHQSTTGAAHAKGTAKTGAAKPAGTKSAQAKPAAGHMPQAASDAQLKQAMGQIATIQTQLSNAQGTGASTAAPLLQKAVQELQTALAIK